jgi:phage-related protein
MAANPVVLFALAIAALVVGLVIAYKKFDAFRDIVDAVFDAIKTGIKGGMDAITGYLTFVMGVYKGIFNAIGKLWNNTIGKLKFKIPDWVPGIGGNGFEVPDIPMLANGGIVSSPTLALIGERGPEAVIPLDRMGSMGGGMNITVQAGLVSTPDQMGQLIIESIQRAQRRSGTVFAPA